ncbi:hypothetical protein PEC301937_13810 [Pectobacterium carotovorum subsp. carotovorum]|nr:hypothetical protein PEC301937_13810 [Pectobacterium carotovorum subsp. carotovorum]
MYRFDTKHVLLRYKTVNEYAPILFAQTRT